MFTKRMRQSGFTRLNIVVVIGVMVAAGLIAWFFLRSYQRAPYASQDIAKEVAQLKSESELIAKRIEILSELSDKSKESDSGSVDSSESEGSKEGEEENTVMQGISGTQGLRGPAGPQGSQGFQGVTGKDGCLAGSCVSLQTSTPGAQESGSINISGSGVLGQDLQVAGSISSDTNFAIGGTGILTRQSNGAIVGGDLSGNERGENSIDIQQRTADTWVAAAPYSIAIGFNSEVTGSGDSIAIGRRVRALGWISTAIGVDTTASSFASTAIGSSASAGNTGANEALAVGRLAMASATASTSVGYQNSSSGDSSIALGNRAIAAGASSTALGGGGVRGYPNLAMGGRSLALGTGIRAMSNHSFAMGADSRVGNIERVFVVDAGGTTIRIGGGNYTNEFVNGDAVIFTLNSATSNSLAVTKIISNVVYDSGANTTTFTIPTAIDSTLTGGRVVSQSRAQRSGVVGHKGIVTADDAYVFGANITNNQTGSIMVGTSEAGKLTLASDGNAKTSSITLAPTGAKPACDQTRRGTLWYTSGADGSKDDLEVCAKDAGDAYAWRALY